MKKLFLTHIFLNLYLLVLIQPILPIIEYFVNYDYIVSELCENRDKPILTCNGKCYLEKKVDQKLSLNHNHETPKPPKIDLEKFITINNKKYFGKIIIRKQIQSKPISNNILKNRLFTNSLFKPPQASFIYTAYLL